MSASASYYSESEIQVSLGESWGGTSDHPLDNYQGGYSYEDGPAKAKQGKRAVSRVDREVRGSGLRVIVGPVVGEATSDSVRILAETDRDGELQCTLTTVEGRVAARVTCAMKRGHPSVFAIFDLEPGREYRVALNGELPAGLNSSFRTKTEDPRQVRFAAFSCDKITVANHDEMWKKLYKEHQDQPVDVFLHLGDQVYADEAYKRGAAFVKQRGLSACKTDEGREALLELYREIYRSTWSNEWTRKVLAVGSHLMIWDDHELVNDWGTPDNHRDKGPNNAAYFLGNIARQVYYEYQRSLFDASDPADLTTQSADAHCHVYGSVGVLFLDLRGGRSFHHRPGYEASFLGADQWTVIHGALANNGALRACQILVLASSIPLSYSTAIMSCCIGATMPCIRDKMGFGLNRPEQTALFEHLQRWKDNLDGRQILALAGDMHAYCEGEVLRGGERLLTQVITSPIANKPPKGFKFWWMKFLSAKYNAFWGGQFSFKRTVSWKSSRNFTIIDCDCEKLKGQLTWRPVFE
jgi:hypothetical protein